MKKDFITLPAPQKYMTLAQIRETYGSRAVVAYSCSVVDSVPLGGYVIAVQDKVGGNCAQLREFQRNLKKTYPDKKPVFYFCLEDGATNNAVCIRYLDEKTEKVLPEIKIKKPPIEEALAKIPADILAQALSMSIKLDE